MRVLLLTAGLTLATTGFPPSASAALISTAQEIRIGREAAEDLERRYGVDADPVGTRHMSAVGDRLTAVSARRDLPWRFRILAVREINAVSLPGGFIYVTRGMLDGLRSDDELAYVLAHEIAHVNQRHHVQLIEQYFALSIVITLFFGGDATTGQIADFVGFLLTRGFSRGREFEADEVGVGFAHRAGFRADAALAVLERLRAIEGRDPSQVEVLFRTHPGLADRIVRIRRRLRDLGYRASLGAPLWAAPFGNAHVRAAA
ncbi:MAG TPA: M48 family metalloprotease [bacterium]|nr:M48 family metalloprotease [bacterium]